MSELLGVVLFSWTWMWMRGRAPSVLVQGAGGWARLVQAPSVLVQGCREWEYGVGLGSGWQGALGGALEDLSDLDVGVGCTRSVGEQGDRIGVLVSNEREHIGGQLA